MSTAPRSAKDRALLALGIALLFAGVVAGWLRARTGNDYAVLHAMAVGIVEHENVYLLNDPGAVGVGVVGMVYPPAIAFTVFWLALVPFEVGRVIWFLVMNATLVLGVRALIRFAAPAARDHVWMLSAGLLLFSAAIRWGMMLLQGAPFMLGLLCFFVVALRTGRPRLALALAIVAACFKMTLALPFIGLLLLYRRYVAVFVSGSAWLGLNALGFALMGGNAFATYRHNVQVFEALNSVNINGPDPWLGVSLPRLDWVFLFYGVTRDLPASRIANLICAAAVALWLLREGLRTATPPSLPSTTLFLSALVCLGSLCVYHHQYDACLFFAPMLLVWFGAPSLRNPPWAVWLTLPFALIIAILPIGVVQHVIEATLGVHWVGLLKLSFPVAITLALAGSLVMLRRYTSLPREGLGATSNERAFAEPARPSSS
jgi:hypothetical protein